MRPLADTAQVEGNQYSASASREACQQPQIQFKDHTLRSGLTARRMMLTACNQSTRPKEPPRKTANLLTSSSVLGNTLNCLGPTIHCYYPLFLVLRARYRITDCPLHNSFANRVPKKRRKHPQGSCQLWLIPHGQRRRCSPLTQSRTIRMGLCDDRGHD